MALAFIGLLVAVVGVGLMLSGIGAFLGIPLMLIGAGLGLWGVRNDARKKA